MWKAKKIIYLILLLFTSCAVAPIIGKSLNQDKIKDGVYQGSYTWGLNKAKVRVTIYNKKIVEITILSHRTLKGKKAELPIIKKIIENQSTEVDAISGATKSSLVIMNATQNAIIKSYK